MTLTALGPKAFGMAAIAAKLAVILTTVCRTCLFVLAAAVAMAAGPAQPRINNVALVMEGRRIAVQPQVNGLRDGLEEFKYIEGKNLHWEQVEGVTQEELRANLWALLKRQQIDVIVALGTAEAMVARELARNLPLVFLPAADPVSSGLVRSLANPDANLTGLSSFIGSESAGKQLEIFKQAVPGLTQAAVIVDRRPSFAGGAETWQRLITVASWLGVHLTKLPVQSVEEAENKVRSLSTAGPSAGVFVLCSGLFKDLQVVAATAMRRKQPLFGCNAFQVAEQNVLVSYAPDLYSLGYRGAWFLDRIFKGARPQDLPVETPRKFELVINAKPAGEIGIKFPPEILMLADRVFR